MWVVDSEVGQDFAVDFDTGFVEAAHELRLGKPLEACSSVDTLDPECAEVALFIAAVAEGVGQAFFPGVFGNGPDVFACAEVAVCEFKNSFALCS